MFPIDIIPKTQFESRKQIEEEMKMTTLPTFDEDYKYNRKNKYEKEN